MKLLLIDDKANNGWKQLLEKVFPFNDLIIDVALNIESANEKIQIKYDLILLDVRLNFNDHNNNKIEEFSGFKILKNIKNDFLNRNFNTPIILITATNKIWNLEAFRKFGIDSYYIKEHPDFIFDRDSSRQNFMNFKNEFIRLLDIGANRNQIWGISKEIISKINTIHYFKDEKKSENVKSRIFDKLKLGYHVLFKEQLQIEKEILKTNNEALAFIIFWSILEELVKGVTLSNSWNLIGEFSGNWKFKNNEYFIESLSNGNVKINISKKQNNQFVNQGIELSKEDKDFTNYIRGHVNLSEQVYSMLAGYCQDNSSFNSKSLEFRKINKFRNNVDFIHSNIKSIYEEDLIRQKDLEEHYEYCVKVLEFINGVLEIIN